MRPFTSHICSHNRSRQIIHNILHILNAAYTPHMMHVMVCADTVVVYSTHHATVCQQSLDHSQSLLWEPLLDPGPDFQMLMVVVVETFYEIYDLHGATISWFYITFKSFSLILYIGHATTSTGQLEILALQCFLILSTK